MKSIIMSFWFFPSHRSLLVIRTLVIFYLLGNISGSEVLHETIQPKGLRFVTSCLLLLWHPCAGGKGKHSFEMTIDYNQTAILKIIEQVTTVTPPLIRTLHNRSSQSQPRRRLRKRRTEARHVAVSGSSSVVDPKDVTVAFPDKNINASLPRSEALHNAAISPCTSKSPIY
ncbi:uncharacterized protein BYT42DRAFT_75789 [Radiomyces spectabilis]|uniref:uncharacterized protein n=1 Tax=Radiomyces spectabilis TaxID=64574 RepID=UPI00221E3ECE|nr:uncharacterized protein BYT42DRAFT_75789 [Radiomyces spectabilis]KAI8371632.1 hypothetical protein BYT42DRAFT_75789 [Radiomyces spectabilis]